MISRTKKISVFSSKHPFRFVILIVSVGQISLLMSKNNGDDLVKTVVLLYENSAFINAGKCLNV
jgi:hypothetical protein